MFDLIHALDVLVDLLLLFLAVVAEAIQEPVEDLARGRSDQATYHNPAGAGEG
ncbi:hypothetical protein GCM10010234_81390 [Streptomyces hawaiiensis]|uniref:hypothetical protein n=1 Tax=Streptomyces hawaiiensis TaxID=67305 RepID=UPI0031CF6F18